MPDQLSESRSDIKYEVMQSNLSLCEKEELCANINIILEYYDGENLHKAIDTMTELQSIITITAYNYSKRITEADNIWELGNFDFHHPEITKRLELLRKTVQNSELYMKLKQTEYCLEKVQKVSDLLHLSNSNLAEKVKECSMIFDAYINTFVEDCQYLLSTFKAVSEGYSRQQFDNAFFLMLRFHHVFYYIPFLLMGRLDQANKNYAILWDCFSTHCILVIASWHIYRFLSNRKNEHLTNTFFANCWYLGTNKQLLDKLRLVCQRVNFFPTHPALSKAVIKWDETEQYCTKYLGNVPNTEARSDLDKLIKEGSQLAGEFSVFIKTQMEFYKRKANEIPIDINRHSEFMRYQAHLIYLTPRIISCVEFQQKFTKFCEQIQEIEFVSGNEKLQCEATEAISFELVAYFEGLNSYLEEYNASTVNYYTSVGDGFEFQKRKLGLANEIQLTSLLSHFLFILTFWPGYCNPDSVFTKFFLWIQACAVLACIIYIYITAIRLLFYSPRDKKSQFESFSLLAA